MLLFVLTVLLGAAVGHSGGRNVSSVISTCLQADLDQGASEWQETLTGSSVSVEWGYGNMTCNSVWTCFGVQTGPDPPLEPQLLPLVIQKGDHVRFFPSPSMDVPLRLFPLRVSAKAFQSCDPSLGEAVFNESSTDTVTLQDNYLLVGSNYFLVNTTDPIFKCQYGLRLNITVKPRRCSSAGQDTCWNRGRCTTRPDQPEYTCSCCEGYTGPFCEEINACVDDPCMNHGTCTDIPNDPSGTKYKCHCSLGFYGEQCQHRISSFCKLDLCANGGICEGNQTHYQCRCPIGFDGHHCEINANDCASNPCRNGICIDKVASYECYCAPGYSGINCDIGHNQCKDNPCSNGGVCIDRSDHYLCDCPRGFTGHDCSIKVDLCKPNPCSIHGICEDQGQDYKCLCKEGFQGTHCEININECLSNPCSHHARCIDGVYSYKCVCAPGLTGKECDIPVGSIPSLGESDVQSSFGETSHLNNLFIVAGTLGGAILLALLVLAGCYCRTYKITDCRRGQYERHEGCYNEDLKAHMDVSSVGKPRPSAEAIYEATTVSYKAGSMRDPLINSIRSKKI